MLLEKSGRDPTIGSQVMALLSRCSGPARTGPLRGPGCASPSRCSFAAVLEQPGNLLSLSLRAPSKHL